MEHFARVLLDASDGPTLFLIDEVHGNDQCTDANIEIARSFVESRDVLLIGVEGYEGGRYYHNGLDKYTQALVDTKIDERRRIGSYPRFAHALLSIAARVIGVDCAGMCDKIQYEAQLGKRHPLQVARSRHFIDTLIRDFRQNEMTGNMLLNCGTNHNQDVEDMILAKSCIQSWLQISFVRLRSVLHPSGPF